MGGDFISAGIWIDPLEFLFVQDLPYAYADRRPEQSARGDRHDFACGFTASEDARSGGRAEKGTRAKVRASVRFAKTQKSSKGDTLT